VALRNDRPSTWRATSGINFAVPQERVALRPEGDWMPLTPLVSSAGLYSNVPELG